jgi:SAM-dependent methyltransferase
MATSTATGSAVAAWKERIDKHNAQTLRVSGGAESGDRWSALAQRFKDDPRRTDDPVVNLLVSWLTPDATVLDVGGGAGRYALPLALSSKHVTVVDPSPSMLSTLRESASEFGIENVTVVQASWEEARVDAHDLVLCANVVYGVADIARFVQKLSESARDRVAIVVYMDAPLSRMSPIWNEVHGEKRIDLPALPELLPVLWEMEIYPDVSMLPAAMGTRTVPSLEAAIATARNFLYVEEGSEKDRRLREVAAKFVVETPAGLTMRGASERPQGVVSWRV